jgi:repressor LexA
MACRQRILDFISDFLAAHHYPPTVAEIATGTGKVKSVVQHHLNRLERDGQITRTRRSPRSIKLTGVALAQSKR